MNLLNQIKFHHKSHVICSLIYEVEKTGKQSLEWKADLNILLQH